MLASWEQGPQVVYDCLSGATHVLHPVFAGILLRVDACSDELQLTAQELEELRAAGLVEDPDTDPREVSAAVFDEFAALGLLD
jgi:PqqD family protein of HPr-rel-A system